MNAKTSQTIYLDHQATTPVDPRVFAEMRPYFETSYGNPHSTDHVIGWTAAAAIENSAVRIAKLIGADPDEIIFTSGATESNNLSILGSCRRRSNEKRNRILLSAIEHKSILALGRVLETQLNYQIQMVPVDQTGRLVMSEFERMLDDDVFLVSVMAVNNEIGTIQDVESIATQARNVGALMHCDAAQAALAIDLSSFADYVDMLSLSSHKMYGPKGVGILYVNRSLKNTLEPLIYGGGQQGGLRSGTLPVPLCVGMAAAADICASSGSKDERSRLVTMRDELIGDLFGLPWEMSVNGPTNGLRHPGNINIRFPGFSAHEILTSLQPYVAASTGSACSTGVPEPSHVLQAIGLSSEDAEASIRFSIGRHTTAEEVQRAAGHVRDALEAIDALK